MTAVLDGEVSSTRDVLDELVCPESRTPLVYFPETAEREAFLFSPVSRLRFPIVDGIPNLVIEHATRLRESEAEALLAETR